MLSSNRVFHSAQHLSIFRGSAGLELFQMSVKGDVNESPFTDTVSAPCSRVAPVGFSASPGFFVLSGPLIEVVLRRGGSFSGRCLSRGRASLP